MWIEIFKTGTHTDSSGDTKTYDEEMLDSIAGLYNAKIKEDACFEAPIVKGHPKTDDPAFGWVERLARSGKVLLAKVKELNPDFINEVKRGAFKKVSIALYPDLLLRHVGYLGAVQPAVHGLKLAKFASSDDFSEIENEFYIETGDDAFADSTDEFAEKLNNLNAKNSELLEKIAELEKQTRTKSFSDFADSLLTNSEGPKIRASQTADVVRLLETTFLMSRNSNQYSEHPEDGTALQQLKNFLMDLHPIVSMGEYAVNPSKTNTTEIDFSNRNVSAERLKLHSKALEICRANPQTSYEEAVRIVESV